MPQRRAIHVMIVALLALVASGITTTPAHGTLVRGPNEHVHTTGTVDFSDQLILSGSYASALPRGLGLSTDGNVIGFTGHVFDAETGLLLARLRVHDAVVLGRWLSRDPAGFVDGMNLYVYVRGNPLVWWDPLGLAPMPAGTRATWASDNEVHFSLHNPYGGGEAVLRMRRICQKDGGNRWLLESADGLSWPAGRTLLEWAVENWGESGRLDYGQDFRNQLARMLDPQATESEHVQRQINEARAQAAEDLQPFIDALRTGGEIGIGLVPGGGLAVFLGTPSLMNAAAMLPLGGAAAKVVGAAGRGAARGGRIAWRSWGGYGKVTVGGREYAKVGDRLYTRHAVDRMQPSGLGTPAGGSGPGRSIAPNFVEDVIQNGTTRSVTVNGVERTIHTSGSVQVVTEQGGRIVVTVNPFSGGG
ncbi:MAG: RHS repeat-associated core domain-containing protein [Phycisphaeraceae bacterium]|nr:RHS repeat-associated core domain-containing protein [Phycisphaeraceae bacterium]